MKKILINVFILLITFSSYVFLQDHFVQKNVDRVSIRMNIVLNELLPMIKSIDTIDYLVIGDSTAFHSIIPNAISKNTWSLCIPGSSPLDFVKIIDTIDTTKIKKGLIIQNSFSVKHGDEDFFQYIARSNLYSFFELFDAYSLKKGNLDDLQGLAFKVKFYFKIFQIRFYLKWEDLINLKTYFINKLSNIVSLKLVFTSEILSSQGFYQIKDVNGLGVVKNKFKFDINSNELSAIDKIAGKFKDKKVFLILPDWIKNSENTENLVSKIKSIQNKDIVFVNKLGYQIPEKAYWDNSHFKLDGSIQFTENLKRFIEKN